MAQREATSDHPGEREDTDVLIELADLEAFAVGCGVLGAGGGGETKTGLLMARHAIARHGPVRLVRPGDLQPDQIVLPCGLIGAPTVSTEKVLSGAEGGRLVERSSALLDRPVAAIMSMEIGGTNGLVPLAWAAEAGLPLVDADGIGRAFPLLTQMTMAIADVPVGPVVLTDERGHTVTLDGELGPEWAERLARSTAVSLGGRACISLFPMAARVADTATVVGSVTRAQRIGRTILDHPASPAAALCDATDGRVLVEGKVGDVERLTNGGFMRGSTLIEGSGEDHGRVVRIEFQNENLLALEDGEVVAATPDLITVLDAVNGQAIATEELHYGQRVSAVVIPSAPFWRTPAGLAAVGPEAFGYEVTTASPDPIVGAIA